MTCGNQNKNFPDGGYGDAVAYFDEDWSGMVRCRPVEWQTPYSIYTRDDYKRCVCDLEGDGEDDCGQEGDSNNDNDDSNNDNDNSNSGDDSNSGDNSNNGDNSNTGGDSNSGDDSNNNDNQNNDD